MPLLIFTHMVVIHEGMLRNVSLKLQTATIIAATIENYDHF